MMKANSPRYARPWLARAAGLLLSVVLLALTLPPADAAAAQAPVVQAPAPAPAQPDLVIRVGPNRDAALADVGLLRGDAVVSVSPAANVARVRFYIDPPAADLEAGLAGEPYAVAERPPFSLQRQGRFDSRALPDGPHTLVAAIELRDGRTIVRTARLQVSNGAPALLFEATPLEVSVAQGGSAERAVRLLTNTGAAVRYKITSDAPWLKLEAPTPLGNPKSGTAPGWQIVQFDAAGLAPGTHTATLTATGDGLQPATTTVVLAVQPAANCAPLDCTQVKVVAPYTLAFDQDQGGLPDANGVGTGFTWVDKPTAGGTGYIPANLAVDTAASLFKLTTTGGIAYLANNNQDNTLGVGIDAADQVSLLDTKLVNFPPQTGNYEQAGLWYGMDDDNYLKLVVVYEPAGPRVQFLEERAGAVQQQVVSGLISVSGATLQLRMRADPVAKTVTGYYSLNEGALQELSVFTVPPALFNADGAGIDPALGTRVFGGVFGTDRFLQGTALFQFDYFSLTAEQGSGQAGAISWDRKSFPFSYPSSLLLGRDGRLYATETFGNVRAIAVDANLDVVSNDVIATLANRLVLGIAEDPASTPQQVILWVAHSDGTIDQNGMFQGAVNSGIVSRFVGPGFAREDIITGLPRARESLDQLPAFRAGRQALHRAGRQHRRRRAQHAGDGVRHPRRAAALRRAARGRR